MRTLIKLIAVFCLFGHPLYATDLYMPSGCATISACNTAASSGDTVWIADGTYNQAISGLKAGVTFQAVNDGAVKFTSTFDPGDSGFTMRGIIIKSSNQKDLGSNNTYDRMSFVGGPSSGNVVNSLVYNGTTITDSAFYGQGGRYLLLAYQQTGGTITLNNIIFRPDGGWAGYSNPQAALNYYNSNGLVASGLILIDAITTATSEEVIGGLGCNSHVSVGSCGTISNSAITGCDQSGQYYGRFYADGNGNVSMTLDNVVVYDNTSTSWSITRNVDGKTTILKATVDGTIEDWDGTAHSGPTGAADFELDGDFLNNPRWTNEMCDDEGVTRGVCAGSSQIGTYVAAATGLDLTFDTDIYIAQSSAGAANGSSCSNARAVSWFNDSGNWGGGGTEIDPGDTVHLCGTITTTLSTQSSGTSGNEITIYWEDDARVSQVFCGTSGCINAGGDDYLIFDGGTNGILEATDNGTSGTYHTAQSAGIYIYGSQNIEIKNLTFQNLYVRSSYTDTYSNSYGSGNNFIWSGGSGVTNLSIHDNTFSHATGGFLAVTGSANISNIDIYDNTFTNIDHNISIGATTATISNIDIYGNDFSDYENWDDTSSNRYHHNALHIYTVGAATYNGLYIHENYCHGDTGALSTSHFYLEASSGGTFNDLLIYNNILTQSNSESIWQIAVGSTGVDEITNSIVANNTVIGASAGFCILLSGSGTAPAVENNVLMNCNTGIYFYSANSASIDYNLYSGNSHFGYDGSYRDTLSAWQSAIGDEANAVSSADPGISALGVLYSDSDAINAGTAQTAFNDDYVGTLRPQSTLWDIGAYEYNGGVYTNCDIDEDGDEDTDDLAMLVDMVLGRESQTKGDLNEDTVWNILDVQMLVSILSGAASCPE